MIEARQISKRFGQRQVLCDLNFLVREGEILGILGANGAGKSTLFNILATLDESFDGHVHILGMDIRKNKQQIREKIGYVPGRFSRYSDLTVEENLSFFASAYGYPMSGVIERCPKLWQSLELFSGKQARYLSGGMKQKLAVCCALVHDPKLLLLDEPTTGIDPVSRYTLWQELKALQKTGTTILISTHYLEEAAIADRVLFIHEGKQLMLDLPENILARYRKTLLSISGYPVQQLYRNLLDLPYSARSYIRGENLFVALPQGFSADLVADFLRQKGLGSAIIELANPDMEDVFIDQLIDYKGEGSHENPRR